MTLAIALLGPPASAAPSGPDIDPRLVGPWHTVSIDGDALFLVIHGVELDFEKNGTFTARIRFTDGQTETKRGTYALDGDRIDFSIPSLGKESGTYEIKGKDLSFHDTSFGVTVKVAKGKAQDSSGHDLF